MSFFQSGTSNARVEIANRIYMDRAYNLKDNFRQKTIVNMGSTPTEVDFQGAPETTRRQINQWVETQTRNRIKDLLEQGSVKSSTKMILVNAIYFKGDWKFAFDKTKTNMSWVFTAADGSKVSNVPMMSLEQDLATALLGDVGRVLRLPYTDERLSMYIVLPEENQSLDDVEEYLGT